ncbi:O-methyltransferase, partial [Aspergillus homomorphus CBS 101889]
PRPLLLYKDGREQALQTHILQHPNASSLQNQPASILAEIDQWAADNNRCMMTIGPERSAPIVDLIRTTKPQTMTELGGYIGYSAIKFGEEVRRAGGTRYCSLEYNPEYAAIARSLVEFAGLGDFVTILVGDARDSLAQLAGKATLDLLFLDHSGRLYLQDLLTVERLGLLVRGAHVVADNVWLPGAEPYAEFMGQSEQVVDGRVLRYETRTLPYVLSNGQQVS